MEKDNIDIFKTKAKIISVKRIKYLDWRYLTNNIILIMRLVDNAKARDIAVEQEERKNRIRSSGLFSSIFNAIELLGKKPKSEEYYDGYKAGASDAIDLCKHYFVSTAVDKEKEKKLIKFLHDEGITICTNPNTGNIMICDMYKAGEFIEKQIVYE